jgi:hypothetical protein
MEDSKKWISESLKKFGFFPELTTSSKYIRMLKAKKGLAKADFFLYQVDLILENSFDPEFEIAQLVGEDEELLRLVYSTGIGSSIHALNLVFDILDDLEFFPEHIMELGGANGWALSLLNEFFEESCIMTLVEMNKVWRPVTSKIKFVNLKYEEFFPDTKADLIFSIFGAPSQGFEELIKCAERSLSVNGYFITVLRIPNDIILNDFLKMSTNAGLGLDRKRSGKFSIKSFNRLERFPILVFSKLNSANGEAFCYSSLREL